MVAKLEAKHKRSVAGKSFATVLRQFGVPVAGGTRPTAAELAKAYKTALRQFHPDRALRRQESWEQVVETEEVYKLLQTLYEECLGKGTSQPQQPQRTHHQQRPRPFK